MKRFINWLLSFFTKPETMAVDVDNLPRWYPLPGAEGQVARLRFQRYLLRLLADNGSPPQVTKDWWETFLAVWEVAGSNTDGDWWDSRNDCTNKEVLHILVTGKLPPGARGLDWKNFLPPGLR